MKIAGHDIGVCSWSLRVGGMAQLIEAARSLEIEHVHLALGGLVVKDAAHRKAELATLTASNLRVTAGMIAFPGENYATVATIRDTGGFVPDRDWEDRHRITLHAGEIARELGLHLLTTHVGFIPPSNHPKYQTLIARVREVAEALGDMHLALLLETGQESAGELLQFVNDLALENVGVNFDPANMILYGAGDPIEAIQTVGRHIGHVHIKDACLSSHPGVTWGEEVVVGTGQVPLSRLLEALETVEYTGPLAIEREAGNDRIADIRAAIAALRAAEQRDPV